MALTNIRVGGKDLEGGGKTCLSEHFTKASRVHTRSGSTTSSPTEKPKCRSSETEADSYHNSRDSLKGPSCRRSSFCCTSTTFGESYPKTLRWPFLPTVFHSSAVTPIQPSLNQPYRKL